jgi:hypothetical protein
MMLPANGQEHYDIVAVTRQAIAGETPIAEGN